MDMRVRSPSLDRYPPPRSRDNLVLAVNAMRRIAEKLGQVRRNEPTKARGDADRTDEHESFLFIINITVHVLRAVAMKRDHQLYVYWSKIRVKRVWKRLQQSMDFSVCYTSFQDAIIYFIGHSVSQLLLLL
jgi:hypothetical protein